MKYHERTSHSFETKSYPFSCEHVGCNLKFLNKKKKLAHHNEEEPECMEEKLNLIDLISCFKGVINQVIIDNNIDKNEISEIEEVISLKNTFEDTVKNLLDSEKFVSVLGNKFTI